jgi:enoyl-CoA hydratase
VCIGEPIDAEIARAPDRVSRVVPPGPALAAALNLARELAERPIRAPQLLEDAVELAGDAAEDDAIRRMLGLADAALRTEDARAGVHAFFAKEAPPVTPPVRGPHACVAGPC